MQMSLRRLIASAALALSLVGLACSTQQPPAEPSVAPTDSAGTQVSSETTPADAPTSQDEAASTQGALPSVEGQQLHLASSSWPPFTGHEPGPHLATDLVREALRRAGVSLTISMTRADALTRELENQTYDGWDALWKSEQRSEDFYFSLPYLENRLVLLGRAGSDVSFKGLAELSGKSLGVVEGYAYGSALHADAGPSLVYGRSDSDNLEALLRGQLDYILVEELLVFQLFEVEPVRSKRLLSAGTNSLITQGLHLAIRRNVPRAEAIIARFDQEVRQLIRDGSYQRILSVGWISVDSNKDGREEIVVLGAHAGEFPPERHYRLFGSNWNGSPQFMIEGQVYKDWETVPERYKSPPKESLDRFQPPLAVVLMKF